MSKVTVTFEDAEGEEFEVVVEFYAAYQAAMTWGLPEDCYPEDSELDLESITRDGKDFEPTEDQREKIEDRCWEKYFEKQSRREEE